MQLPRISLPPVPFRLVLVCAYVAAAALWVGVIAYWSIHFMAPPGSARPVVSLPTPEEAARTVVARHLFGRTEKIQSTDAAPLAVDSGTLRVLGLASSDGSGKGFAIVSLNGKPPIPAIEGQEFAPGLRLLKVTSSGIEYERGGVIQRAVLSAKGATEKVPVGQALTIQNIQSPAPSVTIPVTPTAAQ